MADNITKIILSGEDRTGGMFNSFRQSISGAEAASNGLKTALGALGLSLTAAGLVSMVKGAIDAADHLNDLSKSTSLTIAQLSGLKLAALQSGTDLDGVAKAVNKLSVEMGKNGEAFASIGVKSKDPMVALQQLADVFVSIEDPQLRAAMAAKALGKGWQDTAPLLAEGGDRIGVMVEKGAALSGVTQQMADDADEFNDRMAELSMVMGNVGVTIAKDVLPILNALAESLVETAADADGASSQAFPQLSEVFRVFIVLGGNVAYIMKSVGNEIGGVAAQIAALASGDFKGFSAIGDMMKEDAEKARAAFDTWEKKMLDAGKTASASAEKHGTAVVGANTRVIKSFVGVADAAASSAKAYESVQKSAAEFIKSLEKEAAQLGMTADQKKLMDAATVMLTLHTEKERREFMESATAAAQKIKVFNDATAAAKFQADGVKRLTEEAEKYTKVLQDSVDADQKSLDAMTLKNDLLEKGIESVTAMAVAELEAKLASVDYTTATYEEIAALEKRLDIAKRINAQAGRGETLQAARDADKQMTADWKKSVEQYDDVFRKGFADMVNGGTATWKSFTKSLATTFKTTVADQIYKMFAQPFVVKFVASLLGITGATGMSGAANAAGGAANAANSANSASGLNLSSFTSWDGFSNATSFGANSAGQSLYDAGYQSSGSYLMENASTIGDYTSIAGQTLSYASALYSASEGKWGQAIGQAVGTYFFGPLGSAIGGYLGGWVDEQFGGKEEVSGQGVTMDVRGTSALGGSWTSYHRDGGWFSDDNNRKTGAPLADAQMAAVSATLTGVRTVVKGLADELGDPSILRRLDDFSASYNGASDGLDAWLKSVTESMLATALPGLEQFRRAGEDTQSVITRLAQTLQTIESLTDAIDSQIGVMSGGASQYGYDLAAANQAINDLYETLGNTVDIQARVEIEGRLYQQVIARYQLEQQYLGELSGVLTQSLQSVRDARAAVGGSLSGVAGTPAPTVAELREAIAGSVAGLSLPSMQPVFDASLAMQQAAADFTSESDRIAESNKEIRTYIGGLGLFGGAANGHEQVAEFNTLMDMARNAGILAAGTMNYSNYRDSNAVISLKDGYRFTLDGTGIGQTANITHAQDWVDVNGIGWSRWERTLGMEYYKPQGYEQVGAGVTTAVTDTAAAYQQAQDDFTAAMQAFAGDATQATEKLQGLREETLKYYDTQQQLADLMRQTAEALGQTISSLNRANMVPVSRYEDMRAEFDRLYAGADGLGGADLAARAAQLNGLAQPLMDAARESYASSPAYQAALASITGSLADLQARLGAEAPRDYQAESLALLSGIDAALGYIETSLVSADQQIVAAINASRDSTVAVLQDIRALLGGEQTTLSGLPGHADGLSYVPYDNYGARLHQGEAVIDAGTMAGLRRYGIGGGAGGGSPEQLAEQRNTTEELRALVRLQSAANQALLEKLDAMEKRLAGIESKSRMAAAA